MEFLNENNIMTYSRDALNEKMRCLVRSAIMLKGAKKQDIASAITQSKNAFSPWINRRNSYSEWILQSMFDYLKGTYSLDFDIIVQLAEEVYTYEQKRKLNLE